MEKHQLSISQRLYNKLLWTYRFTTRSRQNTIYHCCIQKSGSQWFKKIFSDSLIWSNTKIALYSPTENYISDEKETINKLAKLPTKLIVSPLYVRYNFFEKLEKPFNYKAFFIARDPRDLVISNYFSLKYSHDPYHPYITKMREKLNSISIDDGITTLINSFTPGIKKTLEGWFLQKSENIKVIKFEDIFGVNQLQTFSELIDHCGINIAKDDVQSLLNKYSFKNLSGREQGKEDVKNHYRKGIPGDWKNHFTEEHKSIFKSLSEDLLIIGDYEKDNNW